MLWSIDLWLVNKAFAALNASHLIKPTKIKMKVPRSFRSLSKFSAGRSRTASKSSSVALCRRRDATSSTSLQLPSGPPSPTSRERGGSPLPLWKSRKIAWEKEGADDVEDVRMRLRLALRRMRFRGVGMPNTNEARDRKRKRERERDRNRAQLALAGDWSRAVGSRFRFQTDQHT